MVLPLLHGPGVDHCGCIHSVEVAQKWLILAYLVLWFSYYVGDSECSSDCVGVSASPSIPDSTSRAPSGSASR